MGQPLILLALLLSPFLQDGEVDRILLRFTQRRERVRTDGEFRRLLAEIRTELEAFLKANPAHPDAPRAAFHAAETLISAGESAAGAEQLRRFLKSHPDAGQAPSARFMLGEALLRAEDDAAARDAFREFIRQHPKDERAVYARLYEAVTLQNEGDFPGAETLLRAVRQERPGTREAWSACLQLAVLLHLQEKNAAARALLEEVLTARPDPATADVARKHLAEYVRLGREAPGFTEKDAEAREVSLEKLRGKVVLLYFFDPALTPSVAEVQFLARLRGELGKAGRGEDFVLLGTCLAADRKDLALYKSQFAADWPLFFDGRGLDGRLARLYGVAGQPALWVLDRQGRFRFHNLAGRDLRFAVKKLLEEK